MATTQTPSKAATTKKATARKTTAKKATSTTAKKASAATTKAKRTSTTSAATNAQRTARQKATPLHEREPRTIAIDAGYAAAGLANELVALVKDLPSKVDDLRGDLTQKLEQLEKQLVELRTDGPQKAGQKAGQKANAKAKDARGNVEAQLRELREKAAKDVTDRLSTFERSFDERAQSGRKVTEDLQKDARYAELEAQVKKVLAQAETARTQVKAAVTSVARTGDAAGDAASDQAGNAKSQVKAAATSVRRTVEALVGAGQKLVVSRKAS